MSARGFWVGHHQRTFFTYGFSILLLAVIVSSTKQGMYGQHVREVEMSSFTPLVFSSFRGMGVVATTPSGD